MITEQAKRILSGGAYEALDWLRGDTHQASTIGEFGFVESLGAMRRGYAAGAKCIHVYEVYCRMDTGLPFSHRLLVELLSLSTPPISTRLAARFSKWRLAVGSFLWLSLFSPSLFR